MEVPWQNMFSDMEMEDGSGDFIKQSGGGGGGGHKKKSLDDEELLQYYSPTFSSDTQTHYYSPNNATFSFQHNTILTLTNTTTSQLHHLLPPPPSPAASSSSPNSYILSLNDSSSNAATRGGGARSSSHQQISGNYKKGRSSSDWVDHIMAERKRRQELTERFIALSATIPGLKKIDKASILSEAISYIKKLREEVNKLEEQSSNKIKKEVESASFMISDGLGASCKTISSDSDDDNFVVALPEVEARALGKEALIRVHCKKQRGLMLKIFTHLNTLHLSILCNTVLPFGNSALNITIIAQMGEKYKVTVKELVKSLRRALVESTDIEQ